MKYLVPIDLSQNELQNPQMQNLASAPSNPVAGQFYFNTTTNKAMVYNGTEWVPWEVGTAVYPATATPSMDGTAAVGTSAKYAREDHVHPSDTSRVPTSRTINGKALSSDITLKASDIDYKQSSPTSWYTVESYLNMLQESKVDKQNGKGLSTNDYTTTEKNKLAGIASGAEVNVQSDWNQATTTADDYIKNKPTLGAAAAKGVDSSISSGSSSTNLPTSAAVASFVSSEIGGVDAMRFKGTIGTGGTVTSLPSSHKQGDTYRVITAGTYAGQTCEIGDLIIALGTSGTTASDWTVAQTNIDGAITSISGTTPISVTGSGSSRTVAHENSGVTAASKGDTSNQTPNFGSTFKALSGTVNATGHLTAFAEHTVKIPDYTASSMSKGLMSVADKRKLDGLYNYATDYITSNGTSCNIDLDTDAALNIGQVISVNAYIKETSGNSTIYTKVEVDWYVQILSSSENDYTRVHASISQPAGVPVYVVVVYTIF